MASRILTRSTAKSDEEVAQHVEEARKRVEQKVEAYLEAQRSQKSLQHDETAGQQIKGEPLSLKDIDIELGVRHAWELMPAAVVDKAALSPLPATTAS